MYCTPPGFICFTETLVFTSARYLLHRYQHDQSHLNPLGTAYRISFYKN